jgi:hypothetical protein
MTTQNGSVLGGISDKLIRVLPPAMLVLVLLNIGFLATTMWVVQHNADQRNAMLTRILDSCLSKQK